MSARALAAAVATLALAALAGCGLGGGAGARGVRLTVTADFGVRAVGGTADRDAPQGETVLRLLERSLPVRTRYGGGFVQEIGGLAGGTQGGRRVDWFYYVNGVEARKGAAATDVHAGDRVWWDRHDWGATQTVPAVVGSFPEPFRSGVGGRRLPVRIECAPGSTDACREVRRRLEVVGVPAATAVLGAPAGAQLLRLLVGPWAAVRSDAVAGQIDRGPGDSGVYARFEAAGRRLALLDARGRATRRLGPGTGLVAATRLEDEQPTWVVTGTDARGVRDAAHALEERTLAQRFAVATGGGATVRLPEAGE